MTSEIPAVVLDTNVVLDWFVFRNPECTPLATAIAAGRLRWLVTEAMRNELAHVIGRGVVDRYGPELDSIWTSWRTLSLQVPIPDPPAEARRLRCTDPDDQKFIDLAVERAQWLISRDRAVLKLAGRAARLGLRVAPPARWRPE